MKTTIEVFLGTRPEIYDFTNNCTKCEEYKGKIGFEKYFAYRMSKSATKDPDSSSQLLQDIYAVLWPNLIEKSYMLNDKSGVYSDTMTSVHHTMCGYYDTYFKDEIAKYKNENKRQNYLSSLMCSNMFRDYEAVNGNLKKNANFEKFVSLYHTLGNYTPVPRGFNCARSGAGYSSNHDYWDLTLMKIKEYYDQKKNNNVELSEGVLAALELLHYSKDIVCYIEWLEGFGSWEVFIEKNYFQDYVDNESGEVIPLCKGHSWDNPEIEDYDEFFEHICSRIESRTKRMLELIIKNMKGNE